ncbi:hypothetical protein OIU84_021314 [Salix udensis]|uniref:Uncharacterized protein n=1 Tax=Salix udensis TaxID=889485 RepID=A0AAD6KUE7_9ROSI|nr:hypothetical protein OIU84_021314 [Salix udensis]
MTSPSRPLRAIILFSSSKETSSLKTPGFPPKCVLPNPDRARSLPVTRMYINSLDMLRSMFGNMEGLAPPHSVDLLCGGLELYCCRNLSMQCHCLLY